MEAGQGLFDKILNREKILMLKFDMQRDGETMLPAILHSLIVTEAPARSVAVLKPIEESSKDKYRIIPIWMGNHEATQIGIAIEGHRNKRPSTHDLLLDMLTNLDCIIENIVINDVEGTLFHATILLKQGDRHIPIEARPSDALALAIRQSAPIFVEENVADTSSFPYIVKSHENEEIEEFRLFLNTITPEDFTLE